MKIICDKYLLSDALSVVSKAVSTKSAIPVLEGILLRAEAGKLELTGYDLEIGIVTSIEARTFEDGDVVLSAKLLGDMVRRLDSEEVEIESLENLSTTIKGGITEFTIMGMNPSDFPDMPSFGLDHAINIEGQTLKDMIDTTIYAVSQDDKKPAHTGELFVLEKDKLTLVALDGFRMAVCERPVKSNREIRIIVPAKTMQEVSRIIDNEEGEISVSANRHYIIFKNEQYTVISRLIEGAFLDYQRNIPDSYKTRVVVDVKEFISSIERASLVITERLHEPLRILFSNNITLNCKTAIGTVCDVIDADITGDAVEIGFNNRFLLDALRNSKCERVVMEMTGPISAIKIIPEEGDKFIYLVLPLRLKNN